MNPAEVWRHLEEDTRVTDAPGRVQRRILPSGKRNFLLGLETPSRHRMLILRIGADSVQGLPDVPDSTGLKVRVESRETDGDEAEVVLALTEPQHRDIFDLLVRDLVGEAERPDDEREGLLRFLARLADWQQLLRRLGPSGLNREAQQGLWGELWALREVVLPGCWNEGCYRWVEGSDGDGPRLPTRCHMRRGEDQHSCEPGPSEHLR